jgi:tRNA pseudouridine65 synthase
MLPQILEEQPNYWVLYKPSGWFVHPPSDRRALKKFSQHILTSWFWRNLKQKAYPIHRLDFATEGLMIWAKSSESAGVLNDLHHGSRLNKTYHAVVRGHTLDSGLIELPLLSDSHVVAVECLTEYKTLKRMELNAKINSAHPTSRYSLVEVQLKTGRWHQIRRHFNRISHPIIGDREHGDSHHNRYFRDELKIPGLLLKAHRLDFQCPFLDKFQSLNAPVTEKWGSLYSLFQNPPKT